MNSAIQYRGKVLSEQMLRHADSLGQWPCIKNPLRRRPHQSTLLTRPPIARGMGISEAEIFVTIPGLVNCSRINNKAVYSHRRTTRSKAGSPPGGREGDLPYLKQGAIIQYFGQRREMLVTDFLSMISSPTLSAIRLSKTGQ